MMSERQAAGRQYRQTLRLLREKRDRLKASLAAGAASEEDVEARLRLLQNLIDCCKDNLLVLRESAGTRAVSYTEDGEYGGDYSSRIFYLADSCRKCRNNGQNRLAVLEGVKAVLDQEVPPDSREIIRRVLRGESKQSIAKALGVNVSTVSRKYKKGLELLRRYCRHMEDLLR